MSEFNDIVKLGVDVYHKAPTKYSMNESTEVLRQALIDANGGSTVMNYKNIRDGKCNGLFAIVEEILQRTVVEGFQGNEYFNSLVDFRNIAQGDKNEFWVEDNDLFIVAKAANGTQGIRRQRLGGATKTDIPTELRVVKIYEELNRVLSGAIDFNEMITRVGKSFSQQLLNDIYTLWMGATAADFGAAFYPTAGTYSADALLEVIDHVEAASGKQATILCTKSAARHLATVENPDEGKTDIYTMGYYGKFYGTPIMATPQRHKAGTQTFLLDNDVVTVVASDAKPIKCVYEGNGTIILGDPMSNGDLTQEYLYGDQYGLGFVMAGNNGIGRYEVTSWT